MQASADAGLGTATITCDQNNRNHPGTVLAAALVYARTGVASYRAKVISGVEAARASVRTCSNSILSLGRQLGAYVLAADYVGYRDPGFVAWVSAIRTQELGGHTLWHQLRQTSRVTSNNWGTFALASVTVADAYLRDTAALNSDYAVWTDYGDSGTSTFVHTSDFRSRGDQWICPAGYEINPASCGDFKKEGAAVEDASRTDYPVITNYPAEAAQGYVVTADILAKAGFDSWRINQSQVCRNAKWRERLGNLNRSSVDYYVTWVTNKRCGLSQPTVAAGYGRVFGYSDWLYQ